MWWFPLFYVSRTMILVSLSLVFMEPTTNKCYHQKCKMQVALTLKLMFGIFLLSRKLLLMKRGKWWATPLFLSWGRVWFKLGIYSRRKSLQVRTVDELSMMDIYKRPLISPPWWEVALQWKLIPFVEKFDDLYSLLFTTALRPPHLTHLAPPLSFVNNRKVPNVP